MHIFRALYFTTMKRNTSGTWTSSSLVGSSIFKFGHISSRFTFYIISPSHTSLILRKFNNHVLTLFSLWRKYNSSTSGYTLFIAVFYSFLSQCFFGNIPLLIIDQFLWGILLITSRALSSIINSPIFESMGNLKIIKTDFFRKNIFKQSSQCGNIPLFVA
jgi:hypothetical protein